MAGAQVVALPPFAFSTVASLARGRAWSDTMNVVMAVASLCAAAYLVIYHAGLYLLTISERRYPDRLQSWRIASWVMCGVAGMITLGMLATTLRPTTFLAWHVPLLAVLIGSGIVTLGHLRHLARRIPNSALARFCAILMLLPAIPLLKVFPFIGMFLIFQFAWLLDFIPVLYLPVSVGLFIRFAILFRRAAVHAEEHWRTETATAHQAA
jgi:hypothetical protein